MTFNVMFKIFTLITLICSFNSAVYAASEPEVSKEDARLSFWDMSFLEKAYIETSPNKRDDGITVGTLGVDGGKTDAIVRLAEQIADNKFGKYDSLLISHKDRLIFESYYNRGRVDLAQFQFSASKTYISLAIGRAIQMGYLTIEDLHKPITNFFDDLDTNILADGIDHITLHQAMTMRSGISLSDDKRTEILDSISSSKGKKGMNALQAFLQHTATITPESQTLVYKDADPIFVTSILEAAVPGSAQDFIKKELVAKLGITDFQWNTDINGLPTGNGAYFTTRDMLKIGALMLHNGSWQGEQLISKEYLEKATSSIANHNETWIPKNYKYGYLMYQITIPAYGESLQANLAWGAGGQRILTIAKLDLVVVLTGHDEEDDIIMANLIHAIQSAFLSAPVS